MALSKEKMMKRFNVVDLRIAKVQEVRIGHSDITSDKRLYCSLLLDNGTTVSNVPFYGCGVDSETKKLHGSLIPPVVNQMVGVSYVHGHYKNPVAAFPIHMPWLREEDEEVYNDVLESVDDIGFFHKTGTKLLFKEDGTINFDVINSDDEPKRTQEIDADGNATTKVFDSNQNEVVVLEELNTGDFNRTIKDSSGNKVSEVLQGNNGDIDLINYSGGVEKGTINMAGSNGEVLINGHLKVTV